MSGHQDPFSSFMATGHASAIVGGQFGSEAKGLVAAYIASRLEKASGGVVPMVSTTNAGAQAGHTTILPDGTKFICYHLPTIGVMMPHTNIYLNAGSIIDIQLLFDEVLSVSHALRRPENDIWNRLTIHPHATIITDEAKRSEKMGSTTHLGSTQKGVGAALANKIMRQPDAVVRGSFLEKTTAAKVEVLNLDKMTSMMEIPQGTGLSINSSGFYPKTTSRECWVGQAMVDAGLHPYMLGMVSMVMRTFPIRVGHIYGETRMTHIGVTDQGLEPATATPIIGNSGPFYEDGAEIGWDSLPGVEPERTTVTKRVRRIARWSTLQYAHGMRMNRPHNVFLTFTNYCTREELQQIVGSMREVERMMGMGGKVRHYYSWGPRVDQVSTDYGQAAAYCRDVQPGYNASLAA